MVYLLVPVMSARHRSTVSLRGSGACKLRASRAWSVTMRYCRSMS